MNIQQQHWDTVYTTRAPDEVSWFQHYPKTSMQFVDSLGLPLDANVIDIGGGDSLFVDALLETGFQNITVLDISAAAIERARQRLGDKARMVRWIISDVCEFNPLMSYDLWHDRAAFHFLTTELQIAKYVSIAEEAVKKEGHLLIGTFSESGPKKCSGLEIQQYSEASMTAQFEKGFEKIECRQEDHHTPFNTIQNFLFCSFKKR